MEGLRYQGSKAYLIKLLLKFFICIVYTKLFKTIDFKGLKSINIQNTNKSEKIQNIISLIWENCTFRTRISIIDNQMDIVKNSVVMNFLLKIVGSDTWLQLCFQCGNNVFCSRKAFLIIENFKYFLYFGNWHLTYTSHGPHSQTLK